MFEMEYLMDKYGQQYRINKRSPFKLKPYNQSFVKIIFTIDLHCLKNSASTLLKKLSRFAYFCKNLTLHQGFAEIEANF
jgi:hypothetical protein